MFSYLESILEERDQKSEVFDHYTELFNQRLFVSRINYILLAISKYNENKEPFYLYILPEEELPSRLPDDEYDYEEIEGLIKEEIFKAVAVNFEKMKEGEGNIEEILRRNKFLLNRGEAERI